MSAPALSAPDFADRVIQFLHDVAPEWWTAVAPEHQQATHTAFQAVMNALGDSEHVALINELDDRYQGLVTMAYAAGLRHGAVAEQFRQALSD
jgi:hypothetical protein